MDIVVSLTYSTRENLSSVSGRRLPDKNSTNHSVGKGRGVLAVLLGKSPEPVLNWVLVHKPTELILDVARSQSIRCLGNSQ